MIYPAAFPKQMAHLESRVKAHPAPLLR